MKKIIPKAVLVGLGVGVGSVIYDLVLNDSREFSWWRIAIIGFIAGVLAAARTRRKPSA